jgi:ubiquinone/menaquinone biosynthesis C-methylase UbiE
MLPAARNQCAGPFGALYDFYVEREPLMVSLGRVVWGIDASVIYTALQAVGRAPPGATIVDVPCGGGIALRALRSDQEVRYLAADLSEQMLERTARRAAARGLPQVEPVLADMLALPFPDDSADLVMSLSGLHMVHQPERVVHELTRILKPGGELVGTTFVREGSRRQRRLFELGHRSGHALPPSVASLERWLREAGMEALQIAPRRGFAMFRGRLTALQRG